MAVIKVELDSVTVDMVERQFCVSGKEVSSILRSQFDMIFRSLTDRCSLKPPGPLSSSSSLPLFRAFQSANIVSFNLSIVYDLVDNLGLERIVVV